MRGQPPPGAEYVPVWRYPGQGGESDWPFNETRDSDGGLAYLTAHNDMTSTMRAVTQQTFGGADALQLQTVARPVPLPTEVQVRVRAGKTTAGATWPR